MKQVNVAEVRSGYEYAECFRLRECDARSSRKASVGVLVACLSLMLVCTRAHAQSPTASTNAASVNSPAFLEATLRQQWAAIDEQIQLRQVDQAALGEATKWRGGEGAPLPAAGKEGRVVFVFGATVPRVICAPLRVCDVELQQGESIHDVHAGDATRWDIQPALSGITPHVVLKPLTAGVETNIVIYTDRRVYHVELVASPKDHMPFISFDYPEDRKAKWLAMMQQTQHQAGGKTSDGSGGSAGSDYEIQANPGSLRFGYEVEKAGRWRVRRRINWLPTRVYDDGEKTVIEMPREIMARELPILLVRDGDGKDKIVNYRVKGPHFVVDRIFTYAALVKGVGRQQERVIITRAED